MSYQIPANAVIDVVPIIHRHFRDLPMGKDGEVDRDEIFKRMGEMLMNYENAKPVPPATPNPNQTARNMISGADNPAARIPELANAIGRQKDLQAVLWKAVERLEEKLSPIMRGPIPTETTKAEIEPMTKISAILFDQCRVTADVLERIEGMIERLEI